ncbi:hypothetical protein MMC28_008610 [Mycoblastus sanguinarius]|nr:hypothetical protein [Mycoblastus sanguinarius]
MSTPEDAMRRISSTYGHKNRDAVNLTIDYIRNVILEEGPFQGVIGGSEGASAAATVLIDELETSRKDGRPPAMKCGIFFVAIPALRADGKGWVLSDERDQRIAVPTCHVYSEKDPIVLTSKALQNSCQSKGKTVIRHEKGHIIPHDKEQMDVRGVSQGLFD